MKPDHFYCLIVDQRAQHPEPKIQSLPNDRLPDGNVMIEVEYSSLNYKDALACQGNPGVVKSLPHVPGIDAAGVVLESDSPRFRSGSRVIVTGYDLGQGHWGGWSERIRVPADWIVPLPEGLSTREAMILGTAGFTAAQCVLALQRCEIGPEDGEIVVSGATGGVGSLAVRLLAGLGYQVTAVTGKPAQHETLRSVGANRVVGRDEIVDTTNRPMLSAKWAGAVDTVGGGMLTTLLRGAKHGGCVAACGLVAGAELEMSVYPFLLRGITLSGIASADCPYEKRFEIWRLLAAEWKPNDLGTLVTEVNLAQLPAQVEKILAGSVTGRVIVNLKDSSAWIQ